MATNNNSVDYSCYTRLNVIRKEFPQMTPEIFNLIMWLINLAMWISQLINKLK